MFMALFKAESILRIEGPRCRGLQVPKTIQIKGLGLRVKGSGFGIYGLGFRTIVLAPLEPHHSGTGTLKDPRVKGDRYWNQACGLCVGFWFEAIRKALSFRELGPYSLTR